MARNNDFIDMMISKVSEAYKDNNLSPTFNNLGNNEISYLDVDSLHINKYNEHRNHHDIEMFAKNIMTTGLQQPLFVVVENGTNYRIVSGHKRYKAIKEYIFKNGMSYKFGKKEFSAKDPKVPCFLINYSDEIAEEEALLAGNAHNDETIDERIERVKQVYELYGKKEEKLKSEGNILPSQTRDEYISSITGYAPRTIRKYLKSLSATRSYTQKDVESYDEYSMDKKEYYSDLANHVSRKLGTKVKCDNKKLTISFNDDDQLNDILDQLGLGNVVNE